MSTNFEDLILRDTSGNRPSAGVPGRLFYDTTNTKMQRDNGSGWDDVEPTVTGAADSGWIAAGVTWTYASADDPTYNFTIASTDLTGTYSAGMRVKLTQSTGGTKYFIITKVAFSTDTTVTIYGGTDYDLNNEAISSPYYSTAKAPQGFPLDPTKWTVELENTSNNSQSTPTQNTWYNLGTLSQSIPIGVWRVYYELLLQSFKTTTAHTTRCTLSTANNSESDTDFSGGAIGYDTNSQQIHKEKTLVLTSKTTYYLNALTTDTSVNSINFRGDRSTTTLRAICAYL